MNEETRNTRGIKLKNVLFWSGIVIVVLLFILKKTGVIGSYTYVNDIMFPWWPVALVFGVLAGVLFAVKVLAGASIGKRILPCAVVMIVVFGLAGKILGHINHFFDSSEVVRHYAEIEDKDYTHKFLRSDKYKFTFTVNGDTFEIDVLSDDYNSHDVGDSYVIEYHEGALGEPYYIAVGPVP